MKTLGELLQEKLANSPHHEEDQMPEVIIRKSVVVTCNDITVYPTSLEVQTIQALFNAGHKVLAIKLFKSMNNIPLLESKCIVEKLATCNAYDFD